jgi:serine beta-lactamase-like protein LACTB
MITAKRATFVSAALLLLVQTGAAAQDRFAPAARLVEQARPGLGAPGISVAVALDDRLVWSTGFGLADVENGVTANGETVYRIASISKTMAATAVMQLVEQGRVNLEDPIQKYVPSFPDKGGLTITLRHILTHTSGIRHYKAGEMENLTTFDSIADAIRIFKDDPLLFTPGTKYSYSTYAFNLLAGVVEAASGLTFEAYLQEHVWTPAGMHATRLEHPGDIVPHRTRQYVKAGGTFRVANAPYADLSVKWAGGGIISTVEDLIRFHIALDEGRLLKPDTLQQMYTPATLNDGTHIDYGLGWMIQTDQTGRRWIFHSGGATGGTTFLLRDPAGRLAVALMCNVQNAGNIGGLARAVAEAVRQVNPAEMAPAGIR